MHVILVRHATHNKGCLSRRGRHHAELLARALADRHVQPTLVLSSDRPQAKETAGVLAAGLAGGPGIETVVCKALDPVAGNPGGFDDVVRAALAEGADVGAHDTVLIIGHEGRLSGLVVQLAGRRERPFPPAGALAVTAPTLPDLRKGCGRVEFRYPVVDHQEQELRPKVQSKMTVASFLAGFVSAALATGIFVEDFSTARQVATVFLTSALALLIAAVYIYDELGMPEGFWVRRGRRGRLRERLETAREAKLEREWESHVDAGVDDERLAAARWIADDAVWRRAVATEYEAETVQDGPMYRWMIATWSYVFTPAIVLALVGFGIVIFDAGALATGLACALGVAVAVAWLTLRRPPLGSD